MKLVFIGLSLSSSWGNGHATTYRALLKALDARGHDILFLECDKPWYARARDLIDPPYCRLAFYAEPEGLGRWRREIMNADLVMIGSYVVDGVATARRVRPWARQLGFYDIDTPVTVAALERGDCEYLDRTMIGSYDFYFSFTGGPMLRHLEQSLGARRAVALHCAVDPDLYQPRPRDGEPRWHLGYLGTYSADRQKVLQALLLEPARALPHLRFAVAGPQYPTDIAWPANVTRIEHLAPHEHAAFYNALGYALNVTRADMVAAGHSPSVRLFEAAACATPVISDCWDGLADFFSPGVEILTAADAAEVIAILSRPAAVRRQIGQAARRAVLARHTAAHRALALEAALGNKTRAPVPGAPARVTARAAEPLTEPI